MWSIYGSGSLFWTDHGDSTVEIPEYERNGRSQREHEQNPPPGNDTINRQEMSNSWKDCSWHCAQSGNFTHMRPGTHSFLGAKKERPAVAQPRQGFEHGALIRDSQMFAPVPIALLFWPI